MLPLTRSSTGAGAVTSQSASSVSAISMPQGPQPVQQCLLRWQHKHIKVLTPWGTAIITLECFGPKLEPALSLHRLHGNASRLPLPALIIYRKSYMHNTCRTSVRACIQQLGVDRAGVQAVAGGASAAQTLRLLRGDQHHRQF